jgi:hypothetical protein
MGRLMKLNDKIFNEQIYILRDFLYHYASYRCLHQNFENLVKLGSQEFWVLTINAHYFEAINLWCMVFGTDNNETHWKKLGLCSDLKPLILTNLDLTNENYSLYWHSIIEWRNKYSAHRVPGFLKTTPDLKLARNVVIVYEEWLEKNVDFSISFSLELYEEKFLKEVEETVGKILLGVKII